MPGRQPKHADLTRRDDLDADEHPQQRGLPTAARPEQAADLAPGKAEGQVIQDDLPAAAHDEAVGPLTTVPAQSPGSALLIRSFSHAGGRKGRAFARDLRLCAAESAGYMV